MCIRDSNARAAARGEAEVDIEGELQRLTAPVADPALREEVRELVVARNRRREARGEAPLDVEREVERQLRELGARARSRDLYRISRPGPAASMTGE